MVSKENDKVGGERTRPIQIGFSAESREIEQGLDLNELLIVSPSSTFFFRLSENIKGDGLDLHTEDILVVDRAEIPRQGRVVIFSSEDGFMLGRCGPRHYELFRAPNESSNSNESDGLMIWGVVTGMIRHLRGRN